MGSRERRPDMTDADRPRFAAVLTALGEVYDREVTPTLAGVYYAALAEYDIATVERVAQQAIQTCRFFPKPAELRELAGGRVEDQAELAWVALLDRFRADAWRAALPDDPITQALVRVHWGSIEAAADWWARCPDVELHVKHQDFVRLYALYAQRPAHERPALPGTRPGKALADASRA